jgi:hypothetical protein
MVVVVAEMVVVEMAVAVVAVVTVVVMVVVVVETEVVETEVVVMGVGCSRYGWCRRETANTGRITRTLGNEGRSGDEMPEVGMIQVQSMWCA